MIMIDTDLKTDIQIKGHAGYAPAGSDIVCAAVSILYETLKRMLRPGLDGTVIEDENGIRIEINPDLRHLGKSFPELLHYRDSDAGEGRTPNMFN